MAAAWLAVWVPAYCVVWGWQNFLQICDIAVFLTCIGLWRGSSLLLSSQAVGAIALNLLWCADFAGGLLFGKHPVGGTEYMFDAQFPLWVRLMSLFHVVLPVVLVWAVRRVGYDRRGWKLMAVMGAVVMVGTRLLGPEKNLNYVYTDPLFNRTWGPVVTHLLVIYGVLAVVVWGGTHLALVKWAPGKEKSKD